MLQIWYDIIYLNIDEPNILFTAISSLLAVYEYGNSY